EECPEAAAVVERESGFREYDFAIDHPCNRDHAVVEPSAKIFQGPSSPGWPRIHGARDDDRSTRLHVALAELFRRWLRDALDRRVSHREIRTIPRFDATRRAAPSRVMRMSRANRPTNHRL